MSIPFTQFLMPDGRQVAVTIDRPEAVQQAAKKLIALGCKFEIEMLWTGEISMEIMRKGKAVCGAICPNGPPVTLAVDKMIEEAMTLLSDKMPI